MIAAIFGPKHIAAYVVVIVALIAVIAMTMRGRRT
jgi:hypothetical protein